MKRISNLISILVTCTVPATYAADSVGLDKFISEAMAQSLILKIAKSSADAKAEDSRGIRLPPPQVGFVQMNMEMGSGTGYTIGQAIPFPTKVSSDHSARTAMASAKKEELNAKEMEIRATAKFIYFRLWEAEERRRLLNEKVQIVANHIKLARAASRSDSFLKIHVIKAENDLDLLKNEIIEADQVIRERQIEAAEFLNRSPNTYRPVASDFPVSEIPDQRSIRDPHQLEQMKFELESLKSKESFAKSQWLPDFNVQYKDMGETPSREAYKEIMISATIPFAYFWQPMSESGKASAERMTGQYQLEKATRKIDAEKSTFLERAKSLKLQLDMFANELLPRAEQRMKIVNNLAPRDMETLQDQRETKEAFPDLKLKSLEIRKQYEYAIMELEKFKSEEQK
ncbi:MAG: TolC family protein [Bdellovibrionales bacterium]|nr:TolC family protein [Bdellovibrionales bacterium]